jgi:hypothetical protein
MFCLSAILALLFASCEDWLTQKDENAMSAEELYSSVPGVSSIAANLYARLRYEQDFNTDGIYDLTSWDEASNNSAYWAFTGNKNQDYRAYYDYDLIRAINVHLKNLKENLGTNIPDREKSQRYFIAEARYLRAFVYFTLVSRMGGVPIVEEVMEYSDEPLTLAKSRDKEADVYDYICRELDEIVDDLNLSNAAVKTRATKGSALALKCRAMLYAGTIAANYEKNVAKGLILPSGATGIAKEKATDYFKKCLDAYFELKESGRYALYAKNSDLATNYANLFLDKSNSELIFYKDYDGNNFTNFFTEKAICRSLATGNKTGAEVNPVLNLLDCYEKIATRQNEPFNPYNGANQAETMGNASSTADYVIFDNPADIFEGRDPRLNGTALHPGSMFRGIPLELQAGLAIKTTSGFNFKSAPTMEDVNDAIKGYYNGLQMTGAEGPHKDSWYVSHSGFLIRKFIDTNAGSESEGKSAVPYIVFRYGEVLLNAAEAAYYLSENGVNEYQGKNTRELALETLNAIRKRAGGDSFQLTDTELTFDRIMNERRVELAFEDHRYNDLKRRRIADEVWAYDPNNASAILYGLWLYKIVAPGENVDGKYLYRRVKIDHRGSEAYKAQPLNFDLKMYYATYPITDGNPYIEKNPNH